MARKTNFTREMSDFYRSGKRRVLSDSKIAQEMGISASSLSRIKNRKAEPSARLMNQFQAETQQSDYFFTNLRELERLSTSSNSRTSREARRAIEKVQNENPNLDYDELYNLDLKRPTVWRTVRGKRIGVLLGRSKQDEQKQRVEAQLRAQGVDPEKTDEYYDEALQESAGIGN